MNSIYTNVPENKDKPKKIFLDLVVDDKPIKFELDTGAAVSTMSLTKFKSLLPRKKLSKTNLPLRTYTGEPIKPIGYATVNVKYKKQLATLNLYVIDCNVDTVFGREWMRAIRVQLPEVHQLKKCLEPTYPDKYVKLAAMKELKKEFASVFLPGVGKINNFKASMVLRKNVTPIYKPARPVPYALRDKVDAEIARLEKAGIITKVEYSDWGTPVVFIIKSDQSIRLCADYKITLNNVLVDDHYPIPNTEDIFATTMNGGKHFAKIDIRQAYMHMPVTEETALMQTISTQRGDYKVNRLMFGTKNAPAIWQRYMSQTLQRIPGVCVFFDDIRVQGASWEELLHRVKLVLAKLQDVGLRINTEKSEFFKTSIEYLGFKVTAEGLAKTSKKINAVINAPRPKNISELRGWLGLVNYYGRFFRNLSANLNPLYNLLKKNVPFNWTSKCENAFNYIKKEMTSERVLCAYNPDLQLLLATDASSYGLGAVLAHVMPDGKEKPIAYASRTLTAAEKNYSQIDKEATAIFWGINHFFNYCYGRKFTLVTDHKPLVSIFGPKNKLPSLVATRMLHYAQFLQGFNYDIMYKSTRLTNNDNSVDSLTVYQLEQIATLPVTHHDIAKATLLDLDMKMVYNSLNHGTPLQIDGYKGKDFEFTLSYGCIMKGSRVVIPNILRKKILNELHCGHLGVVKMKALARSYVWWPRIDADIENLVKGCKGCERVQKECPKGTIHAWEFPSAPWRRLHIDFAGPFMQFYFLIVVDAYSKWPEIYPMRSITARKTIEKLRDAFARFGLPMTIVSDNGTTFTSEEFRTFLRSNGIKHKFSAPYHPATNGQAERYVQTMKTALRKVMYEPGSINLKLSNFLLQYRKTPNSTTGISPCVMLHGRDIRTIIDLINPNVVEQMREKHTPCEMTRHNREFKTGDLVSVRNYKGKDEKWSFGKVVRRDGLLNYYVSVNGQLWRRHIDQMRATNVVPDSDVSCYDELVSVTPTRNESIQERQQPLNQDNQEKSVSKVREKESESTNDTQTENDKLLLTSTNQDAMVTAREEPLQQPILRRSVRIRRAPQRFAP